MGLQSLFLFGSDILTREIATARASTSPQSCSSLLLELSDDKFMLGSFLRKLQKVLLFLSESIPGLAVSCWEVRFIRFFVFEFNVKGSNDCSV